eukprot:GHVU01166493.1.p1 GENE.GHVU01166493.1~~GHVU01166493.1.p1  ORF type:complete len:103 (+),score=0.94 GHVU01166493.1:155-463(+)
MCCYKRPAPARLCRYRVVFGRVVLGADVQVPFVCNLVNAQSLDVPSRVQHLGAPVAGVQAHNLRLVPHPVVRPEQLRKNGRVWVGAVKGQSVSDGDNIDSHL